MNIETELKYAIDALPDFEQKELIKKVYIKQDYLIGSKNEQLYKSLFNISLEEISVFRIRKIQTGNNTEYVLTLKSKGMISRREYEKNITEDIYNHLLESSNGQLIIKNRFIVSHKGLKFEFDEYLNLCNELYTVEVEMDEKDLQSNKMIVEESLKKHFNVSFIDVTYDKRYKNSNLHKYF